jgi:hypothetical protein
VTPVGLDVRFRLVRPSCRMVEGRSVTERKQLIGDVRRRDVLIAGAVETSALDAATQLT